MDRRHLLQRLRAEDEGIGLILVIGLSAVMAILITVMTTVAIRSLGSSSDHVRFEQSLAAAEAGIDRELANIQTARNQVPPVTYTGTAGCVPSAAPAGTFSSEASEKAWARAALEALPTSCTQSSGEGEYVAFKDPARQVVYSLGWSPERSAANAKSRLLKAEYIFAPFRPGQAILTGGDLDFSGSVAVNAIAGLPADVHTNSNVVGINNSMNATGTLTASGTLSGCSSGVAGGCKAGQPQERVPVANPRAVYQDYALTTSQWFDLCPDGTVRSPSASGPCQGSLIANSPYNNWVFTAGNATTPGKWVVDNAATQYPGVYYVYGANAQLGNNGNSNETVTLTVLAESTTPAGFTNAATCDKYGGDITWKLFNVQNYLRGTLFIAEGSLYGSANSSASAGVMLAGDKIDLQTSSASVTGSLIANNTCAAAGDNEIQGMTITYDQSVEAPVYSVVNTTLWLEYVG
jgi:hypothetical protein